MAVRKQLQWDDTTDMWPITDASAVHYTYNPSDSSKITSPITGTSYGLDNFLNGLLDRFMTKDEVTAIATNISKGAGTLYNSTANTTAVATPSAGTTSAFMKCAYTAAGAFSVSFDTTTYLASTTKYAASASVGGDATRAVSLSNGAKGKIPYQSAAGTTTFLDVGAAGKVVGWDASNAVPIWVDAENYTTTSSTAAAYSLRSGEWTNTITLPTQVGTYALYIEDAQSGSYAGVFAIKGTTGKIDEISLHWNSLATTTNDNLRLYAATKETKLVLSAANATATSHTVTIKYKKLI
jgi:hypothetical protein